MVWRLLLELIQILLLLHQMLLQEHLLLELLRLLKLLLLQLQLELLLLLQIAQAVLRRFLLRHTSFLLLLPLLGLLPQQFEVFGAQPRIQGAAADIVRGLAELWRRQWRQSGLLLEKFLLQPVLLCRQFRPLLLLQAPRLLLLKELQLEKLRAGSMR